MHTLSNEKGSIIVVLLLGSVVALLTANLVVYQKSKLMDLNIMTDKASGTVLGSNIVERIRAILEGNADCSSPPSYLRQMRDLRYDRKIEWVYERNNPTAMSCLLKEEEAADLYYLKFHIIRNSETADLVNMKTNIEVIISLRAGRRDNSTSKRIDIWRTFSLYVPTLSFYNVIFTGNSTQSLYGTWGSQVTFQGRTLFAGTEDINYFQHIYPLVFPVFADVFYMRSQGMYYGAKVAMADSLSRWMPQRVHAGFAPEMTAMPYEGLSRAWEIPIDYTQLYKEEGYPLPELGIGVSISMAGDLYSYNAANADNFNQIPNTVLDRTSNTCGKGVPNLGNIKPMVFMRADTNMQLDFTHSDNVFCGLVRAKTLTITAPRNSTVALIGIFIVDNIYINGQAQVFFVNPLDNGELPPSILLPEGQTLGSIEAYFRSQTASLGKNFFLPFAKQPSQLPQAFRASTYDHLFSECEPGKYCWLDEVPPPDNRVLFNNRDNLVYLTEEE